MRTILRAITSIIVILIAFPIAVLVFSVKVGIKFANEWIKEADENFGKKDLK